MNVLSLILIDHVKVMNTIKELEAVPPNDTDTKKDRFNFLKALINTHTKAEEKVVYPALKQFIPDTINVSLDEHKVTDDLLKDLDSTDMGDPCWKARLLVLWNVTVAHMNTEEGPVFDVARANISESQLISIGQSFQQSKGTAGIAPSGTRAQASASGSGRGSGRGYSRDFKTSMGRTY
jgi:Hemerythrin HHE cation binding domain